MAMSRIWAKPADRSSLVEGSHFRYSRLVEESLARLQFPGEQYRVMVPTMRG